MRIRIVAVALLALSLVLFACDDGEGGSDVVLDTLDGDTLDESPDFPDDRDAIPDVPDLPDDQELSPDLLEDEELPEPGPYGFRLRTPLDERYQCVDDPWASGWMSDVDHVCTFEYGETQGYVYLQATVTGCEDAGMSWIPVFSTQAWLSVDGIVTPLLDAVYEHGGGHNNDLAEFTLDSTRYRLWHSSFGFGWRKCQPMDCLMVLDGAGEVVEDGCGNATQTRRSLPITCDRITAEHLTPDLTDDFELCPGDEP